MLSPTPKPRPIVRPGFVLALLVVFGAFFIIGALLPSLSGSGKPKLFQVLNNLRQIELVKQRWASDHAATNGTVVSESDLAAYVRPGQGATGLVTSFRGEVYQVNPIGTPAEVRLERSVSRLFPAGTLIRMGTNAAWEKLLPNQEGAADGWQPLYAGPNRISRAAVPRRSP